MERALEEEAVALAFGGGHLVDPPGGGLDEMVRPSPERAYDADFFESFKAKFGR